MSNVTPINPTGTSKPTYDDTSFDAENLKMRIRAIADLVSCTDKDMVDSNSISCAMSIIMDLSEELESCARSKPAD